MRYKVLAVRDRAADVYGQPFYSSSVGGAIRSFSDEVNRSAPDNNLFKHPEDFDLYLLGDFDDEFGTFTVDSPSQIAIGKDVKVSP